jgi:hypothetical protein
MILPRLYDYHPTPLPLSFSPFPHLIYNLDLPPSHCYVVDVPFVDFLPSLLSRLPPPTTHYVMTLPSKNRLVRLIHNRLPTFLLLMNHT